MGTPIARICAFFAFRIRLRARSASNLWRRPWVLRSRSPDEGRFATPRVLVRIGAPLRNMLAKFLLVFLPPDMGSFVFSLSFR